MKKLIKFPISFDTCLRIIIGGRLRDNRLRIFRAWWRSQLLYFQNLEGPAKPVWDSGQNRWRYEPLQKDLIRDNTIEVIEKFRRDGVDEPWFKNMSTGISEWRNAQLIKQRTQAANARWNKSKKRAP